MQLPTVRNDDKFRRERHQQYLHVHRARRWVGPIQNARHTGVSARLRHTDLQFYVYTNVLYSYFINGFKMSEAAVFGLDPSYSFKLIADQTEGARLGIAIANNTDISRTYEIELRRSNGTTFATTTTTVPARQSVARFLDTLISSSSNQILEAEISDTAFSFDSAVMGIRMSGTVLATIPAN